MSDADHPQDGNGTSGRNILSFGCELEFIVTYVIGDDPDPDADDEGLAPILRIPTDIAPDATTDYIFQNIRDTLRNNGLTLQGADLPLPPDVDPDRARAIFGISVKHDNTVHEGDPDRTSNGYRFQGVEINTSASWTSSIAFQEVELLIQVLLHNYRIRVNQSCGLQFHIGNGLRPLNTQTVKRVAALLWCLDPIACHIHPPQRRRSPFSLPIREYSRFANGCQADAARDRFFRQGRLGKPKLGGVATIPSSQPARSRRHPTSRVATSRATLDSHAKLEQKYPDGFGGRDMEEVPSKDVDTALDGVSQCLACPNTEELVGLLTVTGGTGLCKPNYSFTGYACDQNPDGQDEWNWVAYPDDKLTIEFREAVGSMDTQWITSWGRICASIVLYALNASTTEFFGMLMRLAQAQGDFGDAGPVPYDFIDFLDDIGCFAEAELLEYKLQDKKLFWFPCRKLDTKVVVEPQESHGPDPPRGWQWGFGNEAEEIHVHADDTWPTEEPADSATDNLEETNGNTESGVQELPNTKETTEEEQKTVSNVSEATSRENEATGGSLTPKEARAKEAQDAYRLRFPHGYERIQVSAAGLLCGLRALIESIIAQEPVLLSPPPKIQVLQDLLHGPFFQAFIEESQDDTLREYNNLRGDQLAGLLQVWGRTLSPPLNLRLGFVSAFRPAYLYPASEDMDPIFIWIFNNDAQDERLGIIGHYEGLRPIIDS